MGDESAATPDRVDLMRALVDACSIHAEAIQQLQKRTLVRERELPFTMLLVNVV